MRRTIHQPRRIGQPNKTDKHLGHDGVIPGLIPIHSWDDTRQDEAQEQLQGDKVPERDQRGITTQIVLIAR